MTTRTANTAGFRSAYAAQRAAEGRRHDLAELMALPWLERGPLARQWSVRARTYEAFVRRILDPVTRTTPAPLRILDLGAGNAWLAYRAARAGHDATALDIRDDDVDGLGAAAPYLNVAGADFHRVAASFDALPLRADRFDIVVFNASLHYAVDLALVLGEARRVVRSGGRVVVLDSPFYARAEHGEAMVAEKHRDADGRFGVRASTLLAMRCVEYLTPARLHDATVGMGLSWRRHRVRYPLWYERRQLSALLRRRRPPSRFDLWEGTAT
jgi:SAM-dependent methyltransferase